MSCSAAARFCFICATSASMDFDSASRSFTLSGKVRRDAASIMVSTPLGRRLRGSFGCFVSIAIKKDCGFIHQTGRGLSVIHRIYLIWVRPPRCQIKGNRLIYPVKIIVTTIAAIMYIGVYHPDQHSQQASQPAQHFSQANGLRIRMGCHRCHPIIFTRPHPAQAHRKIF